MSPLPLAGKSIDPIESTLEPFQTKSHNDRITLKSLCHLLWCVRSKIKWFLDEINYNSDLILTVHPCHYNFKLNVEANLFYKDFNQ